MKLHADGTVEGTPEEIMKYLQLKMEESKPKVRQISCETVVGDAVKYPGEGTIFVSNQPSQAMYDVNAKTTAV